MKLKKLVDEYELETRSLKKLVDEYELENRSLTMERDMKTELYLKMKEALLQNIKVTRFPDYDMDSSNIEPDKPDPTTIKEDNNEVTHRGSIEPEKMDSTNT